MRIIYYVGNLLVEKDSTIFRIVKELENRLPSITFKHIEPAEEIDEEDVILLDTCLGIKRPQVITDLQILENAPSFSLHDFDILLMLKLMLKIGKIKRVVIIAVPPGWNDVECVKRLIVNIFNGKTQQ